MDVYLAIYNHEPTAAEGEGVLDFKKGELFEILSRADGAWWTARRLSDNSVGYVPSSYMKIAEGKSHHPPAVGTVLPDGWKDLLNEQEVHKQALKELQNKVKPLAEPAAVEADNCTTPRGQSVEGFYHTSSSNVSVDEDYDPYYDQAPYNYTPPQERLPPRPDYPMDGELGTAAPVPFHHQYNMDHPMLAPGEEEALTMTLPEEHLIGPHPLPNPVMASKKHKELQRELIIKHKTGEIHKPELKKLFADKEWAAKQKQIEEERRKKRTSLDVKLQLQHDKLEELDTQERKLSREEESKPEFMKIKLKHHGSGSSSDR